MFREAKQECKHHTRAMLTRAENCCFVVLTHSFAISFGLFFSALAMYFSLLVGHFKAELHS